HLALSSPIKDANGDVTHWLAVAFDIHDRRVAEDALRASERRFESIFHLSPQPLAITRESDGRFLTVNDALVKLFGFSREELVGRTSVELGMWSVEERTAFVNAVDAGAHPSAELSKCGKGGRPIRVILSSARSEIDGVPCLVNAVTDVTEQREIEDALRRAD